MNKIILCIDFNNIAFMSCYNSPMYNSKNIPIHGIKSFFYKMKSFIETFQPSYIIFSNDIDRNKTFRRKLYKPYKANRKPSDPDMKIQMEYIMRLVALMGYPILNNELYEADDVLGMISRLVSNETEEYDTVIISSDKDLYQLIDNRTYVMSPKNNEIIDLFYLENNYQLTPSQWIELKMLQGDRGDNIPGIPGIGEISAIRLLKEYKSIENIYNHLNQLRPKTSELLTQHKEQLPLWKELVTIITDYKILNLDMNNLKITQSFPSEIYLLLNELELSSMINLFQYELLPYNDTMTFN